MRTAAVFFVLFGLLPGLAYQSVQDHLRTAAAGAQGPLGYFLGIAPNALGGLSMSCTLMVILLELAPRLRPAHAAAAAALAALASLWAWEIAQLWIPRATFDAHDLAWTLAGTGAGYGLARLWFAAHVSGGEESRP